VRKIIRLYEEHAAAWDAEFRRVRDRFAGQIRCGRGCSACCSQMFSISPLEAAAIARTVAAVDARDRERLRERAHAYLRRAAAEGLLADDGAGESVTPRTGVRIQCPALLDDACSIYEARPLICRKWGIPVFDPATPHQLHACELNFRAGDSIPAGDILAGQSALLEQWVALKAQAAQSGITGRRTTIAEAILQEDASVDGGSSGAEIR
jgi:Fe-S-cluster containining protein